MIIRAYSTSNPLGKLFADKGCISRILIRGLLENHILQLVTDVCKKHENKLIDEMDKYFLCICSILERIYDELKNILQVKHTRHSSLSGFMTSLIAGLVAYCHEPNKPTLDLQFLRQITVA